MSKVLNCNSFPSFFHRILILLFACMIGGATWAQQMYSPFDGEVVAAQEVRFGWYSNGCDESTFDIQVSTDNEFSDILFEADDIDANETSLSGLPRVQELFWRVRAQDGEWTSADSFCLFMPTDEDGCILWLDPDSALVDVDGAIDSLLDRSSSGSDFYRVGTTTRPMAIDGFWNGRRVLFFDGVNDRLSGTGWSHPVSDFSFNFLVDKLGEDPRYMMNVQSGRIAILSNRADGAFFDNSWHGTSIQGHVPQHILLNLSSEGSTDIFINDELVDEDIGYSEKPLGGDVSFGSIGASSFFDGYMGDVIVYDHPLDSLERSLVNGYYRSKFSPPVNLGPDLCLDNFCDTVIKINGSHLADIVWGDGSSADSILITSPGTYSVQVTDLFGNVSFDSIEVIRPIDLINSFILCAGQDSTWNTGLDPLNFDIEWNVPNEGPSLLIQEAGDYTVTVVDGGGCQFISDVVSVSLDYYPDSASLGPDSDLCTGNAITLLEGQEETVEYAWSDGSNEDELPILNSGDYWLEAINVNGCVATDTITVTIIGEAPTADFGFTNICLDELTQFVNNSEAPDGEFISQWAWDFGDSGISDASDPQHIFQEVDTFQVTLTATTEIGCSDSFSQELIISPLPVIDYTIGLACSDQEVLFSNTSQVSTGFVTGTEWLFNGSDMASTANHNYLFASPGDYPVRLVSFTNKGCSDTLQFEVEVFGSPVSIFTADPVCAPEESFFIASPDTTLSGAVNQYSWDFGGGEMVNNIFPQMVNQLPPGLNPVQLTVTALNGCADDTTQFVLVGQDPVAAFSTGSACVGLPVQFLDESEVLQGDTVQTWTWFFSDGTESSMQNTSFTYDAVGTYEVSLNVESQLGCANQILQEVEVSENPTAFFTFEPEIGAPPLTPELTNLSEGAQDYEWQFDFGQLSQEFEPMHTFTDTGQVAFGLTVFNEAGCQSSYTNTISLTEPITDLVLIDAGHVIDGDQVRFQLSVSNWSNYDIESFIIELEFTDGPHLQEVWEGDLQRNTNVQFTMDASVFLSSADLPFYCLRLLPSQQRIDADISNNEICKEIGDIDQVYYFAPSPNPARDILSMTVINAYDEDLVATMYDASGRQVLSRTFQLSGGLIDELTFDTSKLKAGIYSLRIERARDVRDYRIQILRD